MNTAIISVGTELLTGAILNTNSQFLSKELSNLGFSVHNISTVGDNPNRLREVINNALTDNSLLILTGGLGPTEDDLTKEVVADYFDLKLETNKEIEAYLKNWFKSRNIELTENNLKQAKIPEDAIVLFNENGTAPGIYINKNGKHVFLLPGPPGEMKALFEKEVLPKLKRLDTLDIKSNYYNLTGIGESLVETELLDLIHNKSNPSLATYSKQGEILLRLTANGTEAIDNMEKIDKEIKKRLGKYIFTFSSDSLVQTVGKFLIENNLTLSSAESCTGGLIGAQLTDIPGISSVYQLGLITYSNEAKMKVLNVKAETLEKYGAVSEQTCREMCKNVRDILGTDIGIATTGIAGPDGGTKEKPVGLVYTGIATKDNIIVKENLFYGNRNDIRNRTCNMIFQMIRNEYFTNFEEK